MYAVGGRGQMLMIATIKTTLCWRESVCCSARQFKQSTEEALMDQPSPLFWRHVVRTAQRKMS